MYAPPLWIADQARNDEACPCRPVVALPSCVSLWIPAYAGMTVRDAGNNVCPALPLWIDESLITLCQRVRLQRGRTSFFIILVPMNGRVKPAMTRRVPAALFC